MAAPVRNMVAILAAGIWINACEFVRNEVLLKSSWNEHYQSLGLMFPAAPLNAVLWIVWGFLFAAAVYILSRKFDLMRTALLGWFVAFVLMWVVIFNMGVFPPALLLYAIPLSLLETFGASYLCLKLSPP